MMSNEMVAKREGLSKKEPKQMLIERSLDSSFDASK